MNRVIIYPYSLLFAPFVRHLAWEKKYNVVAAIIPGGWCPKGMDSSYIDENEYIGIPIKNDFDKALEDCDIVIWAEYDYDYCDNYYADVKNNIIKAMNHKKNIICCQKIAHEELEEFNNIASLNKISFDYVLKPTGKRNRKDVNKNDINVPIVAVMGVSNNCLKFETQLFLRRHFIDAGYRVSQVGTRLGCEILDFHSFPSFMYDNISETDKMDSFLDYIIEIQNTENPDIIIIGIPGGIYPLNMDYNFNYGITAYEICNAIQIDLTVLNVWCDNCSEELIRKMENVLQYRYNTSLDYICLSNISINKESLIDKGHILGYNVYSYNELEKYNNLLNISNIYNLQDESKHKLFKKIIESLS